MTRAEAIAEGRRKLAAGEFNRLPVKTEPESLFWDWVHLECGHKAAGTPGLRDLVMRDGKRACNACAKEWIEANSDE